IPRLSADSTRVAMRQNGKMGLVLGLSGRRVTQAKGPEQSSVFGLLGSVARETEKQLGIVPSSRQLKPASGGHSLMVKFQRSKLAPDDGVAKNGKGGTQGPGKGGNGVGKCDVCHNPHNYHTISIPCDQVDKFLSNHPGDFRGKCEVTGVMNP